MIACVAIPSLALQVLLRDRPSFRGHPVAVASGEGPEARLLELSREALAARLRVGIRQGDARDLVPGLRTAVVRAERLEELREDLLAGLGTFSPRVEAGEAPGGVLRRS